MLGFLQGSRERSEIRQGLNHGVENRKRGCCRRQAGHAGPTEGSPDLHMEPALPGSFLKHRTPPPILSKPLLPIKTTQRHRASTTLLTIPCEKLGWLLPSSSRRQHSRGTADGRKAHPTLALFCPVQPACLRGAGSSQEPGCAPSSL